MGALRVCSLTNEYFFGKQSLLWVLDNFTTAAVEEKGQFYFFGADILAPSTIIFRKQKNAKLIRNLIQVAEGVC